MEKPFWRFIIGLKWEDINLEQGSLRVQRQVCWVDGEIVEAPLKTKNAYRTLPLSADAVEVLREQRKKSNSNAYVFPSSTGGPISLGSVLHMLHRVLKRAELPKVRFHDPPSYFRNPGFAERCRYQYCPC